MLISIVIPTYNGAKTLAKVFKNIYAQKTRYNLEIICVDSSSQDRTLDICRRYGAKVMPILKEQFNHGLTRDLGISNSQGDLVVLLTQDAVPANEFWLDSLVKPVIQDERVAGAYSRQLIAPDCDPLSSYHLNFYIGCSPEKRVQAISDFAAYQNLIPWEKFKLIHFADVSSCIRKSIWEEIPFGKKKFAEDMAWAKNVLEAGYKISYEPSSAVIHSHNYSCFKLLKRLYVDHQNLNRLIGLKLVPSFSRAMYFGLRSIKPLWEAVDKEMSLSPYNKLCWKTYAIPYAIIGPLGQYLGAGSISWPNNGNWATRALDKFLSKNI